MDPDLLKVFITGASSGLGRGTGAPAYAEQGAALAGSAASWRGVPTYADLLPYPERHRCYSVDVTDRTPRVARGRGRFLAHHGMVDVVIASASVLGMGH